MEYGTACTKAANQQPCTEKGVSVSLCLQNFHNVKNTRKMDGKPQFLQGFCGTDFIIKRSEIFACTPK